MTHDHRTMAHGPMPCRCHWVPMVANGQFLGTRNSATRARQAIEPVLAEGKTVVLDFAGVEAITNAWADELVAKLREQHGDRVRWEGTNTEVADAIHTAISRRATPTPRS